MKYECPLAAALKANFIEMLIRHNFKNKRIASRVTVCAKYNRRGGGGLCNVDDG